MIIKRRLIILLIMLALINTFFACKSTPSQEVVINKNDKQLKMLIETSNGNGHVRAPLKVKESFEIRDIHVNILADIYNPNVDKYPVFYAEPYKEISGELIASLTNELFKNQNIWQIVKEEDQQQTKAELDMSILRLKQQSIAFENYIKLRGYEEIRDDSIRSRYKKKINSLGEDYKTAPNYWEAEKVQFNEIFDSKFEGVSIYTLNESKEIREGELSISGFMDSSLLYFVRDFNEIYTLGPLLINQSISSSISEKEAISKADEVLLIIRNETGKDYRVTSTHIGYERPSYLNPLGYENIEEYSQCYAFSVSLFCNNIPAFYAESAFGGFEKDLYNKPWFAEKLIIFVDDKGVKQIEWRGMGRAVLTVNEDVRILSFEDILTKFKSHLELEWAYEDKNPSVLYTELKIDRITLGMARVIDRNNQGEYLMIPVWDFFGKIETTYKDGELPNHSDKITNEVTTSSVLTINAIDGSIIDRNIGY